MEQLSKEQEKALREYRTLALKNLRHWQRYGYKFPSPYKERLWEALTVCTCLGIGKRALELVLND
jgi:hypothetical protein